MIACVRLSLSDAPTAEVLAKAAVAEVLPLLAEISPRLEAEPPDRYYLDLSHLLPGEWRPVGQHIGQHVRQQSGLTPALGLAPGKFCAGVAATITAPGRLLIIRPGREAAFLAAQPIGHLPLDDDLARRLDLLGLGTLGQFAQLPASAVLTQFGRQGRWLQQLAQGRDHRSIPRYQPPPSEQGSHYFDEAIADEAILARIIHRLTETLAKRLEGQGRAAQTLYLILHLENGTCWQEQRRLNQPASRQTHLVHSLLALLARSNITAGITGLTIRLTNLSPVRPEQLDLFSQLGPPALANPLDHLLAHLAARYGPGYFYKARLTAPQAYLPEQRFEFQEVRHG